MGRMSQTSIESIPGAQTFSAISPSHRGYYYLKFAETGQVTPYGGALARHYRNEAQRQYVLQPNAAGALLRRRTIAAPQVAALTAQLYGRRQEVMEKPHLTATAVTNLMSQTYGVPVYGYRNSVEDVEWWLGAALPRDTLSHQSALLTYDYADPKLPTINEGFSLELDSRGYVNMLPGTIALRDCGDVTEVDGLLAALQADVATLTNSWSGTPQD